MTHEQLLNKLYYKDLNFIGVNALYILAKKQDKTITKEFVSNWVVNPHNNKRHKLLKRKNTNLYILRITMLIK